MKPTNLIAGLFLILLGAIFFMNNLGYDSWYLLRLLPIIGPILLILFGLSLLWKGKISRGVAFAIVLLVVGTVILLFPKTALETVEESFLVSFSDYPALSAGALELNFGAGRLAIGSTTESWAEGRFLEIPALSSITETDQKLKLKIRAKNDKFKYNRFNHQQPVWELNLSPQLAWEVFIHTGAIKGDLDLRGVPLHRLDLNCGAGEIGIRLGNNSTHTIVKVSAGASSLKISIPESTGIRVHLDGALTKTNFEEIGLFLHNKRYVSANYETATERIDLELNIAVSNFELKRIPVEVSVDSNAVRKI
ncbi:MAG TPA: hypothetical protein DDW93_12950 [Firmicutes bacterium]|jgi:hypothetical protein|nr:hypothetical protein [Bacillota bacterium]HBK67462.1 hypothetical protein [Bacillota bacterium]HBT16686.1 hypothetical protein [Bacillota bacterium]